MRDEVVRQSQQRFQTVTLSFVVARSVSEEFAFFLADASGYHFLR